MSYSGSGDAQACRQAAKGDGVAGAAQSQTGQKLQSISVHAPVVFKFARQPAMQDGLAAASNVRGSVQRSPMYWTKDWLAHLACTAASSFVQEATVALSTQPRNRPPPQMHWICGLHSLGHQQASFWAVQRSLASMHSHALIAEHESVVVAPPCPVIGPLPVMLPPQPATAIANKTMLIRLVTMRMARLNQQFMFHRQPLAITHQLDAPASGI